MAATKTAKKTTKKKAPAKRAVKRVRKNAPTSADNPNVYSISPDQSFVDALAKGILEKAGHDPLKLSDVTVIMPTRHSINMLRDALVRQSDGKPGIMPTMMTLADLDNETFGLKLSAQDEELAKQFENLPEAVPHDMRRLILAQEILKIPSMARTPQEATRLAKQFGTALDRALTEGVSVDKLKELAPRRFKQQWGKITNFLRVITHTWPKIRDKEGWVDPITRRDKVIDIQAEAWRRHPPKSPVILAGTTGSQPATRRLMKVISALPMGAVVLPGVSKNMDNDSWDAIEPSHPQYTMKAALEEIGIDRKAVKDWPYKVHPKFDKRTVRSLTTDMNARRQMLYEAMRPSRTSEKWSQLSKSRSRARGGINPRALRGIDLVEATTQQEEADVIALKMRETLETDGKTAALVTNDRGLARRVSATLKGWNILVEDSAGTPLTNTQIGTWLRLTSALVTSNLAPVKFLECMKHPFAAAGMEPDEFNKNVRLFEKAVLRGPRPNGGFDGLKAALDEAYLKEDDGRPGNQPAGPREEYDRLKEWLENIEKRAEKLTGMMQKKAAPFEDVLAAHLEFAESMAETPGKKGADRVWTGMEGRVSSRFLSNIKDTAKHMPRTTGQQYTILLQSLMGEHRVHPAKEKLHPRLSILSPLEARLTKPDLVILGGLNEESWPLPPGSNPWMSGEMMEKLGLPPRDRVTGQDAHDFMLLASTPNVLMTRSERKGNAPTVPSRFLRRMQMVLKGAGLLDDLMLKEDLRGISRAIFQPDEVKPIEPPAPIPPVDKRPEKMSATQVELWMRDPYSVYVKQILKLRKLEPIDAPPAYNERGTIIHDALEKFVREYPDDLPENAEEKLLEIGKESFGNRLEDAAVRAFWWPRYERIVDWFVEQERQRRAMGFKTVSVEGGGSLELEGTDKPFKLTAIVDRIDRDPDGKLIIADYKTGTVPKQKDVESGLSPQLVLEALIAEGGKLYKMKKGEVAGLEYWKLSGGKEAGKITTVKADVDRLKEEAEAGLKKLVNEFAKAKTPYLSIPRPSIAPRYNDAAHLARIDEWKRAGDMKKAKAETDKKKKTTRKRKAANTNSKKTVTRKRPATRKGGPRNG